MSAQPLTAEVVRDLLTRIQNFCGMAHARHASRLPAKLAHELGRLAEDAVLLNTAESLATLSAPAAGRAAALEEAAQACERVQQPYLGSAGDFDAGARRAARDCAAAIRSLKGGG